MFKYFKAIRQLISFLRKFDIDLDLSKLGEIGEAVQEFISAEDAAGKVDAFLKVGGILASMTGSEIDDKIVEAAKELAPLLVDLVGGLLNGESRAVSTASTASGGVDSSELVQLAMLVASED